MKKYTGYYIAGAVLVGVGIYLYSSRNKKTSQINLNPPMVVVEEKENGTVVTTTTENTVFTALDKLKELIESIKSKGASTPPINA
jgi:hypothetical protein